MRVLLQYRRTIEFCRFARTVPKGRMDKKTPEPAWRLS
jgi:hypothetical protein